MAFFNPLCAAALLTLLIQGSHAQIGVCGMSTVNARIVGGQNALAGSWPWQASLQTPTIFCGGSLINKRWVLTAAHCTSGTTAGEWTVHLGRLLQQGSNPNEVSRSVTQIIQHPGYVSGTFDNDISLLQLSVDVNFTAYILPVCLAASGSTFNAGTDTYVTGWGKISETVSLPSPQNLQEVKVPIVGPRTCKCDYGASVITSNMICAGFQEGGKDACQGDSGGPLVIKNNTVWVQAGIVSFGEGCAEPNFPGVYTRVSVYETWIKSYITSDQPGFIIYTSTGTDSDLSVSCNGVPPLPTTTMTTTTSPTTTTMTTPPTTTLQRITPPTTTTATTTPPTATTTTTPPTTTTATTTPPTATTTTTPPTTTTATTTPPTATTTTMTTTAHPSTVTTSKTTTAHPATTTATTMHPTTTTTTTTVPPTTTTATTTPSVKVPVPTTVTAKSVVCGQAPLNSQILAANSAATAGEWPWMASLQMNGSHMCGGTLVAEDAVLSAAGCLSSSTSPSEWTVILGRLKQNGSNPFEITLNVTNITLSNLTGSNVAVLHLATRPTLSDYIQPICMDSGQNFPVNSLCWIAGWSSQQGGEEQVLQEFQTSVLDCGNASVASDSICTARVTLHETDAGGPLMCRLDGSWYQAAVLPVDSTINGTRRARRSPSQMVFSKLSRFQSFLTDAVGQFLSPAVNSTALAAISNTTMTSITTTATPTNTTMTSNTTTATPTTRNTTMTSNTTTATPTTRNTTMISNTTTVTPTITNTTMISNTTTATPTTRNTTMISNTTTVTPTITNTTMISNTTTATPTTRNTTMISNTTTATPTITNTTMISNTTTATPTTTNTTMTSNTTTATPTNTIITSTNANPTTTTAPSLTTLSTDSATTGGSPARSPFVSFFRLLLFSVCLHLYL
ncbi:transmembrane protease serine 9-like [Thalassophryne amazonica]|uniref:transmembrane protease serine 9-like n=1 Tax=Thalassophryne amazonica TaxID=390379 RepID=UPI001470C0D6|nr:transmembrane protease serine 9-like [Thalassophryne amazonica]